MFTGLVPGRHTFEIKALDKAGNASIYVVAVTVKPGLPGWLVLLLLVAIIGGVAAAGTAYWLSRRPKKPRLKVLVDPMELIADGRSRSTVTV